MTFLADPKSYTPDAFKIFFNTLSWSHWKPEFIVLHNTGVPSLKQWMDPAHPAKQRIENQRHYERDIMHWHSGVHFFIAPEGMIWNMCDATQDGVHASCFNRKSFGMEMVGDYSTEAFDSGPGMIVRETAIKALAVIHKKMGWTPQPLHIGVSGLHLHKMCRADHHDCPGHHVDWSYVVDRIEREMAVI